MEREIFDPFTDQEFCADYEAWCDAQNAEIEKLDREADLWQYVNEIEGED